MTITARIDGIEQTKDALAARTDKTTLALQKKILSLELQLQSKIQGNLAAGIGLKSRHGTAGLAGSVRVVEPNLEGDVITGSVQGGGGTTWYGEMWERTGHKEIVPVDKKVLSWLADGKRMFSRRVAAQGPRPWFVPPFEEFKPTISAELQEVARLGGNE